MCLFCLGFFVVVFCCCFFGGLCRFVSYEAIGPSQYAEYHLALGFRIGLLPCLKMSVFFSNRFRLFPGNPFCREFTIESILQVI